MIKQTTENFINAWINQDFNQALGHTQITWRQKKDEKSLMFILERFSPSVITGFSITSSTTVMADVRVKLIQEDEIEIILEMRLLRESKPFTPDKNGIWGVNPASIHTPK